MNFSSVHSCAVTCHAVTRKASLSWLVFSRRVGQISDHVTRSFAPQPIPPALSAVARAVPVCPMQSKCELEGSLPRHTKPCLSLVSKTGHEKWGELTALSDPAHLRQFQGAHILTSKLCTQAGIKKAEDSNPVHHQKQHVIPYFGAGFPLSLKELKEPRARSGLEETRCFSESCWHTVYKNTLTVKKEGDGKKGTVR